MRRQNLGVWVALTLSAGSALIYEIAATKILFFYFTESSYSVAIVLSIFLFGLGIGSFSVYKLKSAIKNELFVLGVIQLLVAIYAVVVLTNLEKIVSSISALGTLAVSALVLIIPATFLGAVFPLAAALLANKKKDNIGLVYSVDLAGAIIGSLLAGFLFIPQLGIYKSLVIASSINVVASVIVIPKKYKFIPIATFILIELAVFTNLSETISKRNTSQQLQFIKQSPFGEVRVQNNALFINNMEQCSTQYSPETSERKMANYAIEPLKDTEEKLSVLNIGLGCGLTIQSALTYPNVEVDVVEINPIIVEANKSFSNILENPRVNLIIEDGLKYLRQTDKKYHAILIDIEDPRVAHSLPLYTLEAFAISKTRLHSNGFFALWNYEDKAPGVRNSDKYFDILYYTLKEAFPFVYQYPGVFLASAEKIERPEYVPTTSYLLNTLDKNTLTDAAFESGVVK